MKTSVEMLEIEIKKLKAVLSFFKRNKFLVPIIFIEIIAFVLVNLHESQIFAIDSTSPDWLKTLSLLVMIIALAGIVYLCYRMFTVCFLIIFGGFFR